MYDDVLKLAMPRGAELIGFADDIAVVVAKHLEEITQVCNESIASVRRGLFLKGLMLADHKTEAVLITSRKQKETITLSVRGDKKTLSTFSEISGSADRRKTILQGTHSQKQREGFQSDDSVGSHYAKFRRATGNPP